LLDFFRKIFNKKSFGADTKLPIIKEPISESLEDNVNRLIQIYGKSSDIILRRINAGKDGGIPMLIAHIDGLANKQQISENILTPVTLWGHTFKYPDEVYTELCNRFLRCGNVRETDSFGDIVESISAGNCVIVIDEVAKCLICDCIGWETRSIDEPATEPAIRGAKEGFVETLRTNTALLRRRMRNPRLRIEEYTIGRMCLTRVAIVYLHGLAKDCLVREVRERLGRIDIDGIQESGQLEELIEDAPFSPFPTVLRTERPDKVVANILEGRLGIIIDGTPFVLIVPSTFTMYLTSPEDYFERFLIGSAIRLVRVSAFLISLLLPSVYIAITTYHQELLPTILILSIAAQREGVPFPAFVEALLMELTFETMREAGVRLPRIIGPVISIIGAMVIGDAAIRAGLVSPVMVLVVAFTGITTFVIPVFSMSIGVRLLRFIFMSLAASMGFFGIVAGGFALLVHMVSLRSFGIPYMEPLSPMILADLKDALIRFPWWAMNRRPRLVTDETSVRQKQGLMPKPPSCGNACVQEDEHRKG